MMSCTGTTPHHTTPHHAKSLTASSSRFSLTRPITHNSNSVFNVVLPATAMPTTNTSIASLLVLDDPRTTHNRLWTTHSFRRKFIHIIACGGASLFPLNRHHHSSVSSNATSETDDEMDQPSGGGKPLDVNVSSELELVKRRKIEALEEMKGVVRTLSEGREVEEVVNAASEVRRLARDDLFARETLAMLGAIPPLVGMLGNDIDNDDWKVASLYALLNLAIQNDMNKAAIVKAGAVHKMLHIIIMATGSPSSLVSEAIVANFLGLSALDANKLVIGSSGAVPFLVKVVIDVDCRSSSQMKHDALRALYNLSILQLNVPFILETDLITYCVTALGDMDVSERILSILCNVVSTPEGQDAVNAVPDALTILVDVLNWNDAPRCQEKVLYVLMVMVHKVYGGRQRLVDAGAMSALLELTLVGTTLAQKRASRIIDCLSLDKGKQPSNHYKGGLSSTLSAPMHGSSSAFNSSSWDHKEGVEVENDMMSEEKKAVNQLVQQSLENNMTRIVQRANLPQEFVPSDNFKTLTLSSTSKSLPF